MQRTGAIRDESAQPARPTAPASAPTATNDILRLQRAAGNATVTGLLRSGTPVLQRQPLASLGVTTSRKSPFTSRAEAMNLTSEQAEQLYTAGAGRAEDGVSADQRTGTLFSAAHAVAQTGVPVWYAQFKVEGLSDLNAALGHSGADTRLEEARTATARKLADAVDGATPVQERGASFGFLLVGGPEGIGLRSLESTVAAIAGSVGEDVGLTISCAVMTADAAATSAVLADQARDASVAKSGAPGRLGAGPAPTARFTSTGTDRRAVFSALAAKFGLQPPQIDELYGMIVESRPDALTGFEGNADRVATAEKAAAHVARTGTGAVYVELDVRNLGGLNRDLGRQRADQVLARIAEIAEAEMRSLADLGDAWPFRHGGDEMSFIVVGRRPGVDAAQLEFAVAAALTRAREGVRKATADVAHVAHTKRNGPSGTGIVWGTSVIGPNAQAKQVFSAADAKVEAKKANAAG